MSLSLSLNLLSDSTLCLKRDWLRIGVAIAAGLSNPSLQAEDLAIQPALGLGVALVEEGDDRFRPALSIEALLSPAALLKTTLYGRNHPAFTERSVLFSAAWKLELEAFSWMSTHLMLGGSLLYEQLTFRGDTAEWNRANSVGGDTQWNLGVYSGLQLSYAWSERWAVSASWESHLYPAGLSSLFLVFARKQSLGCTLTWIL